MFGKCGWQRLEKALKTTILSTALFICTSLLCSAADPFLQGTVLDEQGRPIPGATVKIWDCIGACFNGKTVLSDAGGQYVFENKPFRNMPSLSVSMPGRYEVSRKQSGPSLTEDDGEEPRRVEFVLGTPAAANVRFDGETPTGWQRSVLIRSGRDAVVHRYDTDAEYVQGWDYWSFSQLPRNEDLHIVIVLEAPAAPAEEGGEAQEDKSNRHKTQTIEIISPALRLPDPQRYEIKLTILGDADAGEPAENLLPAANQKPVAQYLLIASVRDALGTERGTELVIDSAGFGPPVSDELRDEAMALLSKVNTAAAPWLGAPPKTVVAYEYDAVDSSGAKTRIKINGGSPQGPAWSDIARTRGVAYMPPLRWLFNEPDNVVIHGADIGEDTATLHYRLKEGRGFGAGLGVGPGWSGFFTSRFSAGTLIIDLSDATVREHRISKGLLGEQCIETFGDYVKAGEGLAPQSIRIDGGQDLHLSFTVHDEKLWLLTHATNGEKQQPDFRVENVVVNLAE